MLNEHGRVEEAIERYTESIVIRPAIVAIPTVGGILDAFITSRASKIQRERFERFASEVRDAINQIGESKLDLEFLRSDEFFEFFLSVSERVVRAHESEKLDCLRNAFVNGATVDGSSGPMKYVAVRLAGDLTGSHMRILRATSDREGAFSASDRASNTDFVDLNWLCGNSGNLGQDDVKAIAFDLLSMGLLSNWWLGRNDMPNETDRFSLSTLGKRFVWFLTNHVSK